MHDTTLNEARAHIKEWGIDENAYIMANLEHYLDSNENIDDNSSELSKYHQHCLEIIVNNGLQWTIINHLDNERKLKRKDEQNG